MPIITSQRAAFLALVLAQRHSPYRWNAKGQRASVNSPRLFDCSGLVTWAFHQVGWRDWRADYNTDRLWAECAPVASAADLQFPQAEEEEASVAPQAAASKEPLKERRPRVDWAGLLRRTFDFDMFVCVRCGGRRWVLAYVKQAAGVRAIWEHLGLPGAGASLAPA
ncbi:hypothetical protein [Corallococcus exercitus]|uniref:hypothetical protein n=1 Tax=Corallococcus exercitus TaxID=2316736 RepID=UPI0035D4DA7F